MYTSAGAPSTVTADMKLTERDKATGTIPKDLEQHQINNSLYQQHESWAGWWNGTPWSQELLRFKPRAGQTRHNIFNVYC